MICPPPCGGNIFPRRRTFITTRISRPGIDRERCPSSTIRPHGVAYILLIRAQFSSTMFRRTIHAFPTTLFLKGTARRLRFFAIKIRRTISGARLIPYSMRTSVVLAFSAVPYYVGVDRPPPIDAEDSNVDAYDCLPVKSMKFDQETSRDAHLSTMRREIRLTYFHFPAHAPRG